METHKNLAAAKLAVMRKVGYVQKTKPKEGQNYGISYSFAGEAAIIEAIRPAMIEAGLELEPAGVELVDNSIAVTKNGTNMRHILGRYTFRLTHAESGEHRDIIVLGEAMDAGDKAAAKAATIAYKYALRQTFIIETGDDPDRQPSVETVDLVNEQQIKQIVKAWKTSGVEWETYLKTLGIFDIKDLPSVKFNTALALLQKQDAKAVTA